MHNNVVLAIYNHTACGTLSHHSISANTIEDPVLRRLRSESVSQKEAETAEENRKQMLIRIATIGVWHLLQKIHVCAVYSYCFLSLFDLSAYYSHPVI